MVLKLLPRHEIMEQIAKEYNIKVLYGDFQRPVQLSYNLHDVKWQEFREQLYEELGKRLASKGQSKKHSWLEASANMLISYFIGVAANYFIFPLFGFNTSLAQDFNIALVYSVISIVRSYALRRIFNALT